MAGGRLTVDSDFHQRRRGQARRHAEFRVRRAHVHRVLGRWHAGADAAFSKPRPERAHDLRERIPGERRQLPLARQRVDLPYVCQCLRQLGLSAHRLRHGVGVSRAADHARAIYRGRVQPGGQQAQGRERIRRPAEPDLRRPQSSAAERLAQSQCRQALQPVAADDHRCAQRGDECARDGLLRI